MPDYEAGSWYGILAPTGTPREIIDLLNREIVAAVRSPEITDRLNNEGVIAIGSSPSEFAAYIRKEHGRIGKVVETLDEFRMSAAKDQSSEGVK